MAPTRIDSDPDDGFNWSYYYHGPDPAAVEEPATVLVEPAGVPHPTDDVEAVLKRAERTAAEGFGRRVADELDVPFVQPVFPRPRTEPIDWTHYTTSLDRETLAIDDGPLARIDRQVLAMVNDARERLADQGIRTAPELALNGFSATGSFVNRFAAIHPERVASVTAGGINGMAVLPIESADPSIEGIDESATELSDRPLPYPVGVGDLEALTGDAFDPDAFRTVDQFLYLGGDDDSDPLLYPDAWTGVDERLAAVLVYGEAIHEDRLPTCAAVYRDLDVPVALRVYGDAGHRPEPAFDDVVAFHRRSMGGESIDSIRSDLASGV